MYYYQSFSSLFTYIFFSIFGYTFLFFCDVLTVYSESLLALLNISCESSAFPDCLRYATPSPASASFSFFFFFTAQPGSIFFIRPGGEAEGERRFSVLCISSPLPTFLRSFVYIHHSLSFSCACIHHSLSSCVHTHYFLSCVYIYYSFCVYIHYSLSFPSVTRAQSNVCCLRSNSIRGVHTVDEKPLCFAFVCYFPFLWCWQPSCEHF